VNQLKYKNEKNIFFKGFFIWCLAVIFYFYECFLRVFPNTLSQNFINSFHINAEHFSVLGSSFFISYALMQVPVGILIYKYGVRLLLIIATFLCSLNVLGFSYSTNLYLAVFFRFLMGIGAAFGYISLLSLALNWFSSKHFGFFSGLSQFLGSIGPLLAGAPLAYATLHVNNNWQLIFRWFSIFGLILGFAYIFFIKNKPQKKDQIVFLEHPKKFSECFFFLKKLQIIFIITYTGLVYVAMPIIGSYWGVLYLQARNFPKPLAAFLSSMIWLGYSLTSPIIGKISDKTRRRNPCMAITALIGFIGSIFLLFIPSNNIYFLFFVFISIGIASSGQILSFAAITEKVPNYLKTTILGINNMFLMLCGAIIPSIVGAIIHPDGSNKMLYSTADFERGLIIMPILFIFCFFLVIFCIKETFCRSEYEIHYLKKHKP